MAKDPTPAADDAALTAVPDAVPPEAPVTSPAVEETALAPVPDPPPAAKKTASDAVAPVAEEAPAVEERPADVVLRCPRCKSALRLEPTGTGLCLPCGGLRYDLATLPR